MGETLMIHGTWNLSMSTRIKNVRDRWAGWLFCYASPLSSVLGLKKYPDIVTMFLMCHAIVLYSGIR